MTEKYPKLPILEGHLLIKQRGKGEKTDDDKQSCLICQPIVAANMLIKCLLLSNN